MFFENKQTGEKQNVFEASNDPNLHSNFRDLNEEERRKKKMLAQKLANEWMKKLGHKLLQGALNQDRIKFRQEIYEGKRYSQQALKKMNTIQRQDYFDEIIAYDSRV